MTDTPEANFVTAAENIVWYSRQLKGDGTYTDWEDMGQGARGVKFSYTCETSGIFEVKCEWTVGTQTITTIFDRDYDDPHTRDGEKRKKGDPDSFGVADDNWQVRLLDKAKEYLGNTSYGLDNDLPPFGSGQPKCNLFVAHMGLESGVDIPWLNGNNPFNPYPPVANQWAGVPPIPPDNPEYEEWLEDWWTILQENTLPQPGYIASKGLYSWGSGHCGIVDYDGQWISASTAVDEVNRQANFVNQRGRDLQNNEILPRLRKSTGE